MGGLLSGKAEAEGGAFSGCGVNPDLNAVLINIGFGQV